MVALAGPFLVTVALLATGDHEAAQDQLRAAIAVARDTGVPYEEALSLALLARLTGRDSGEADAIFERLGVVAGAELS